jgi:hypothetical protein
MRTTIINVSTELLAIYHFYCKAIAAIAVVSIDAVSNDVNASSFRATSMMRASVYVAALLVWRRIAQLAIGQTLHQKLDRGIKLTTSSVARQALVDCSLLKVDIAVLGPDGFPLQQLQLAAAEDLASADDLKELRIVESRRRAASNWLTVIRIILRELSICQASHTKGLVSTGIAPNSVAFAARYLSDLRVGDWTFIGSCRKQCMNFFWWLSTNNRHACLGLSELARGFARHVEGLLAVGFAIQGESIETCVSPRLWVDNLPSLGESICQLGGMPAADRLARACVRVLSIGLARDFEVVVPFISAINSVTLLARVLDSLVECGLLRICRRVSDFGCGSAFDGFACLRICERRICLAFDAKVVVTRAWNC